MSWKIKSVKKLRLYYQVCHVKCVVRQLFKLKNDEESINTVYLLYFFVHKSLKCGNETKGKSEMEGEGRTGSREGNDESTLAALDSRVRGAKPLVFY
jgi:hypothetical protein